MNSRHLVEKFRDFSRRRKSLALVTVFETLGSTYSKAGTRMLIAADGESQGLVSGGCLEGDLAERARQVLDSGSATTVVYDLRDDSDELFGLGIGCNGLISVLIQPLTPANGYEPMATLADVLLGDATSAIATVVDSESPDVPCGACVILTGDRAVAFDVPDALASVMTEGCRAALRDGEASLMTEGRGLRVLCAPIDPVPRVLILGAGLDAVPLVNIVAELGWRVSVGDHRPGYLKRETLSRAEAKIEVVPARLAEDIDLGQFDAIIVMSHHLATDREYLRQLADTDVPYLGLLGPPARKERLLGEMGERGTALSARLRGPVGIDIGADTAESIAVSIAAEIQKVLVRAP